MSTSSRKRGTDDLNPMQSFYARSSSTIQVPSGPWSTAAAVLRCVAISYGALAGLSATVLFGPLSLLGTALGALTASHLTSWMSLDIEVSRKADLADEDASWIHVAAVMWVGAVIAAGGLLFPPMLVPRLLACVDECHGFAFVPAAGGFIALFGASLLKYTIEGFLKVKVRGRSLLTREIRPVLIFLWCAVVLAFFLWIWAADQLSQRFGG